MILHPGILAILAGSAIVVLMTLAACTVAFTVLRRWDCGSSSAEQLALERKTYLVSAVMSCILGFEVFSGLIFLFTLEDIHILFTGAMCATGTLNAHPVGWAALGTKIAAFFAASIWVAFNSLDGQAEDYPLVRARYGALFPLLLLVAAEAFLQARFFLGLDPGIITSCCGALFSEGDGTVASELAGLPVRPAMTLFYVAAGAVLLTALLSLRKRAAIYPLMLLGASALFFFVSITAILSFISLYIYQLPTHHCPFDMLQREYGFVGYPLYLLLFAGTLFGVLPGLAVPLGRFPSLADPLERARRRWLLLSLMLTALFAAAVSLPILFGNFSLVGSM